MKYLCNDCKDSNIFYVFNTSLNKIKKKYILLYKIKIYLYVSIKMIMMKIIKEKINIYKRKEIVMNKK